MKIDRTKLKKCSSAVPPDCKALIDKLKSCSHDELLEELSKVETWNCGKSDLRHWVDVLDIFDHILEISCEKTKENQWCLPCDEPHWANKKMLLLAVLQFTVLLIEHSFSRNCYNSMEHLTTLLSSSDMNLVLAVLNLLYAFSKQRLNFIAGLNTEKRQSLLLRLVYLAESWGGKLNGFGLAECCEDLEISAYPSRASTLHFEYYAKNVDDKSHKKTSNVIAIHIDNVDKISDKSPSRIMEEIIKIYAVPEDKQMQLFTHVRLAHSFPDYSKRILCVQARLQAISILVYSNEMPNIVNSFLYNGLIEELVDVLQLQNDSLIELKAAALRTLKSINIHLDKNPNQAHPGPGQPYGPSGWAGGAYQPWPNQPAPTGVPVTPSDPDAGQADYSQAWVEYYHSLCMFIEAGMIEQQSRGNQVPYSSDSEKYNRRVDLKCKSHDNDKSLDSKKHNHHVDPKRKTHNNEKSSDSDKHNRHVDSKRKSRDNEKSSDSEKYNHHVDSKRKSRDMGRKRDRTSSSSGSKSTNSSSERRHSKKAVAAKNKDFAQDNESNQLSDKSSNEKSLKHKKYDWATESPMDTTVLIKKCLKIKHDNVLIELPSPKKEPLSPTKETSTSNKNIANCSSHSVPDKPLKQDSISLQLQSLYEDHGHISKAKLKEITKSAIKDIKLHQNTVQSVEEFIQISPPEYKVAGLYVVDSIVKQARHKFGSDKDVFGPCFVKNITTTFQHLFKCSEEDKPKIIRVLKLWQKKNVFSTSVVQPLLDMSHPNTSNECNKNHQIFEKNGLKILKNLCKERPMPSLHVLRQRESEARLQLRNSIQPTSTNPIFKDLVKVKEDDETSQHLKNLLGDVSSIKMDKLNYDF